MNKKALYDSIMKNVAIEIKKVINEDYELMTENEHANAYDSIFDILSDVVESDNILLDRIIVDTLYPRDLDIKNYIDNDVTIRDFINAILDLERIEISDSVAREEVINLVWTTIDKIKQNYISLSDLMDAYMAI